MNRWGIPAGLVAEVTARDQRCVYCGVEFSNGNANRGRSASWEHIVNDITIVSAINIARCCISCNASKGAKPLGLWLDSKYCKRRSISLESMSPIVRAHLPPKTQSARACGDSLAAQAGNLAVSASSGSRKALVR